MKKLVYKAALFFSIITTLNACELDEYNPSSTSREEIFTTFKGLKGMQATCYSSIAGYLGNIEYLALSEGGTDIWLTAMNKTWAQEVYYYEGLAPNTNYSNVVFKYLYSMINSCNTVIDYAPNVKDGNAEEIIALVAEAHCLRAYFYSALVLHYGPITLSLHESSKPNLTPKRNTIEEIYTQIVSDLKFAAENLDITPYDNNYARCTRKTALGLLARVYAQGAGEGLSENGISYWQRAKEVSEDLIKNTTLYGAYLYEDVDDLWAQANNRNNKEALFIASGPNPYDPSYTYAKSNNILSFTFANPNKMSDIYTVNDKSNYFYGRVNNNILAPSKYLIDCFDAQYDKRWENSFVTAFANFSMVTSGWASYDSRTLTLTADLCTKYGIASTNVGKKIYPFADVNVIEPSSNGGGRQYPAKIWPRNEHSGDASKTISVKNVYAHPYPLDEDEDRFLIYLSKENLTAAEKARRAYVCINIDDLFDSEGKYKSASFDGTNSFNMFPSLSKFNWNYDGAFNANLQYKCGDIALMRMAEVYLIAAEANQQLGDGQKAAEHLNVLRKRACRNQAEFETHMKLTTATENDVFDEYARELCGEYSRWALLKRHKAFETRLATGNPRAAESFTKKNYLRPISYDFLSQIDNPDEYGTNGY